jgi:hypothetical protein
MFNWDDDFDDLVKGDGSAKPAVEYSPPPREVPQPQAATGSIRAALARWFAPALVVAGLAAGVTFPEKFGFGGPSVQSASIFSAVHVPFAPQPESVVLRAYSDAQHRNFVSGLKRFSDADLLAYAAVTKSDLDRAGSVMLPLLQDALTLTQMEIERRNLTAPSVVQSVQDVLIQVPLQG